MHGLDGLPQPDVGKALEAGVELAATVARGALGGAAGRPDAIRYNAADFKHRVQDELALATADALAHFADTVANKIAPFETNLVCDGLGNGKSAGEDHIKNEFLKYAGVELRARINALFLLVQTAELHPTEWREARVTTIYKNKGDAGDWSNQRYITVTSAICKAYERVWDLRLRRVYDQPGSPLRWSSTQGGFRLGRGCPEQCYLLYQAIRARFALGLSTPVGFVDLWKAFPSSSRETLLHRLAQAGKGPVASPPKQSWVRTVSRHMWRVIRDGGRRLYNFIRFQGVKSSRYSVEQGLREGSALSPTLFLVIIDPFIRACKEAGYGLTVELAGEQVWVGALCFADDIALVGRDADDLQNMLSLLDKFAADYHLLPSPTKSEVVVFTPPRTEASLASRETTTELVYGAVGRTLRQRQGWQSLEEANTRWAGAPLPGLGPYWEVHSIAGSLREPVFAVRNAFTGELRTEAGWTSFFHMQQHLPGVWRDTTQCSDDGGELIPRDGVVVAVQRERGGWLYTVKWEALAPNGLARPMPPPPADAVMSWTELWPTLDTPPEKEVQGWTLWGQQMKVVDAYKYLGVWFDRHLTMKRHCDMMKCKGMLKLQSFQNMVGFSDGNGVPADLIPNLFEAYVLSAVVYGMELCEEHGPPVVDTLTTRLTRWMAGYPRRGAPAYPLRRDFGFQSGLAIVWKRYSVLAGILQGMDSDRSQHRLHTAALRHRMRRGNVVGRRHRGRTWEDDLLRITNAHLQGADPSWSMELRARCEDYGERGETATSHINALLAKLTLSTAGGARPDDDVWGDEVREGEEPRMPTPRDRANMQARFLGRLEDTRAWVADARKQGRRAVGNRRRHYVRLSGDAVAWFVRGGGPQPYLCGERDPRRWKLLTQMRIGASHFLRSHHFGEADHYCPHGCCAAVETSEHFTMDCPMYADVRDLHRPRLRRTYSAMRAVWRTAGFVMLPWRVVSTDPHRMWKMLLGGLPIDPKLHSWDDLQALRDGEMRSAWTAWLDESESLLRALRAVRQESLASTPGSGPIPRHHHRRTAWVPENAGAQQ